MIVITGASKGIGKYLFCEFQKFAATVIGTYNNTLPESYEGMYRVDVKDYEECENFFNIVMNKVVDDHNHGDTILINCAGINYNVMLHKSNIDNWQSVIDTNLIGTYNMIRVFADYMRVSRYGRIINFSSIVAERGIAGTSAYAASKSGLWGMTRALAVENAGRGITVNNINLGYFDIGMIRDVPEKHLEYIKKTIPAGKLGDPKDIFKTVQYIIDCEYLNGVSISLNGGLG